MGQSRVVSQPEGSNSNVSEAISHPARSSAPASVSGAAVGSSTGEGFISSGFSFFCDDFDLSEAFFFSLFLDECFDEAAAAEVDDSNGLAPPAAAADDGDDRRLSEEMYGSDGPSPPKQG